MGNLAAQGAITEPQLSQSNKSCWPIDRQPRQCDGRVSRSHRTVERSFKALFELVEQDGHLRPSAHQVAKRAGVSRRCLYLHFETIEDLFAAAFERRVGEVVCSWESASPAMPLDRRIDLFCERWISLVDALNPLRRAASVQEPFSYRIADALRRARRWTESTVEEVFMPELSARADVDRTRLQAALHHATSWSAWGDRRQQGVGLCEALDGMRQLLQTLLAP